MTRFYALFIALALLFSCSDDSNSSNDGDNGGAGDNAKVFSSVNVKTTGTDYFTFSTNEATTTEPTAFDIAFSTTPLTVEQGPCNYFTMPFDPVIKAGPDVMIAKVAAKDLSEVTSVPAASDFMADNTEWDAFIGKNWFDQTFSVRPDLYILKNCSGGVAILDIEKYDINMQTHQITNTKVHFKYNADGSLDFTNTKLDSFETDNSYSQKRYVSLANGLVTDKDVFELRAENAALWLANGVSVKKVENAHIESYNTVTDDGWAKDTSPSFVTLGWYSYGAGHALTAKDYVYVAKLKDGKYAAFEVVDYYDNQGNSGVFKINWKYVE